MSKPRRIELLSRREEKNRIKKTIYLFVGSGILLALLLTFGIPALGKFADLLDLAFGNKSEKSTTPTTLNTPSLDNLPEATNSAEIIISGYAQDGADVEIFINDEKSGTTKSSGGRFTYENGRLKGGSNTVQIKLTANGEESDFSKVEDILFDNEEPKLEISNPSEGQSFSGISRISVSGNTDKDAQVFANGFLANVDASGKFEVFVTLNEGENNIEIKAVDLAGNSTSEKRKVNYAK